MFTGYYMGVGLDSYFSEPFYSAMKLVDHVYNLTEKTLIGWRAKDGDPSVRLANKTGRGRLTAKLHQEGQYTILFEKV